MNHFRGQLIEQAPEGIFLPTEMKFYRSVITLLKSFLIISLERLSANF